MASAVNEMVPANVFIPAGLYTTPKLFTPVPASTNASGITKLFPFIFISAPLETVVLDAVVLPDPGLVLPYASWFCNCRTPAEIAVAPV